MMDMIPAHDYYPESGKGWLATSLDILFPPVCAFCRRVCEPETQFPGICRHCLCQLPLRSVQSSGFAWKTLADGFVPDDAWIYSAAYYQGALRQALLKMKFSDAPDLAPALASILIQTICRHDMKFRAVMAVPLHPRRQKERGYNQAGLMARHIAASFDVPDWSPLLSRVRATKRQSEQQDRHERWLNLAGAFCLTDDFAAFCQSDATLRLTNPILLIDDILTTGVTLTEAARPLWSCGLKVTGLVVASDHH